MHGEMRVDSGFGTSDFARRFTFGLRHDKRESGLGTRGSGLGTRDSGLGIGDSKTQRAD